MILGWRPVSGFSTRIVFRTAQLHAKMMYTLPVPAAEEIFLLEYNPEHP